MVRQGPRGVARATLRGVVCLARHFAPLTSVLPIRLGGFRMTFRRLILVLIAAGALCAIPAPASAYICRGSSICTWSSPEMADIQWNFSYVESPNFPANRWEFIGEEINGTINDRISSYHNNRVHRTWISKNWPNDSQVRCIRPLGISTNLGAHKWPDGSSADNSISGMKLETESEAECLFE